MSKRKSHIRRGTGQNKHHYVSGEIHGIKMELCAVLDLSSPKGYIKNQEKLTEGQHEKCGIASIGAQTA